MNCKICNEKLENGKELVKHLKEVHNYSIDQIYSYFDYSFETREATCPICGTKFKITPKQAWKYRKGTSKGIGCSSKCSRTLLCLFNPSPFSREDVRKKAEETMLKKYGTTNSLSSPEVREKARQTLLNKYGVENASHITGIKEKTKKTLLNKYGVEHPAQSKEIMDKMKKTTLERYGVEHAAQSKEVLDKMKKTTLERYGVENASSSEKVKEKRKQTMLDKYGVEYVSQVKEFRDKAQEKMIQTNLEKYGVEYPVQSKEIINKMKQTNLEKYGTEYSVKSEQAIEKTKKTNLERFGVENVFKNPEIRKKAQETNMLKYGVAHASQSEEIKERIRTSNMDRYGVEYFCQHEKCNNENGFRISKVNREFHELLLENNIENELEFIIDNCGYDLKTNDTLIEINPYYTHNSTVGPYFGGKQRSPMIPEYHWEKTKLAKSKGYDCIHIFDWDDKNKIVNILKNKERIPARKCEVKEIKKTEAHKFLGLFHIQGSTRQLKYAYGLFYKEQLIQVITFGKPRYNKNYEYELLRLCSHPDFQVIGGASKLLKYFEDKIKPKSIISYCDLSKFNGEVYEKLGFTLSSQTPPTKHWYHPKTRVHITDNLLRQRGFDQLHGTTFGKGTSNEQLMREHGYVEIYDCGQLVFTKEYRDN